MVEWKAYLHCLELLALRGFQPVRGKEEITKDNLEAFAEKCGDPGGWRAFERVSGDYPSSRILLSFRTDGVNAEYSKVLQSFFVGKSKAERAHVILLYSGDLQSGAKSNLSVYAMPKISRHEMANHENSILELFHVLQLQFNPLKFALQPEMRLLSEEEKNQLRLSLVSAIPDKEKTLESLLPILTLEGQIATWHGAFIGDVFFFHRSLEGEQAYYRIVRPGPVVQKGKFRVKKDE